MIALLDYGSGNLHSVHKALLKAGADVHREKGHDIDAACGQLRLRMEKESSNAVS
jgi:adenine C2-methylase RlmN of 23S rRNA A2503 and tRNA A37